MKVFNPDNNPDHVLQFMPRYNSAICSLTITYNQEVVYTLTDADATITDGYHFLPFQYEFKAGKEYTIQVTTAELAELSDGETLTDEFGQPLNVDSGNDLVIYRCKAFSTIQQDLQNYKINPSVITI